MRSVVETDEKSGFRWRRLELVGVMALAVTLISLFVGQSAKDYAAQFGTPATETAQMQPRFNAIDYATTGSVKTGMVVIGPCDTHKP